MTSKELSNMVFAIKDKITDKEFKDIMDKLSIKNKEEEENNLYEFIYIKQTNVKEYDDDKICINILVSSKKKKQIKILNETDESIESIIKKIDTDSINDLDFYYNKKKNENQPIKILSIDKVPGNPIYLWDIQGDRNDHYEHNKNACLLKYRKIIPISLKKLN